MELSVTIKSDVLAVGLVSLELEICSHVCVYVQVYIDGEGEGYLVLLFSSTLLSSVMSYIVYRPCLYCCTTNSMDYS